MAADEKPKPPPGADHDRTSVRRLDLTPRAPPAPAAPAPTEMFRAPSFNDVSLTPPPDDHATAVRRISVPPIDFAEAPTPMDLQPIQPRGQVQTQALVRRLQDVAEVSRTSTGVLKRSWDPLLERAIARKVAEPQADGDAVERLSAEAKVMARLDHPGVLPVHDFVLEDGGAWFSMKFAQGRTLEQQLETPGFDIAQERGLYDVLRTFVRVCETVAFAHSRGFLHCDLKPSSVLVGSHGQVYVTDWGSAQRLGEHIRTVRGLPPGTPAWMAPEQAQARLEAIDKRTDVYGLGAILYGLLTGRAPHAARTPDESLRLARAAAPTPPQALVKGRLLPGKLCDVALRALSSDPAQRQASVEQLQAEIESFLRGDGRHETRTFAPGALVVEEGKTGDAAYVISKGRARAFKMVAGDRQVLREMGPGDVFGEAAIFASAVRTASVEALDPLTVTVIQRSSLDDEMGRTFWIGYLVKGLADRFRDVDERATKLAVERERDEVTLEIWGWLARQGGGGPIPRAVPWTPLRVSLCRKFKRSSPETAALVQKLAPFELDLVRDELRVR